MTGVPYPPNPPEPYYEADGIVIYHGDCREIDFADLGEMLATDPPYGIDFRSGWTGSQIAADESTDARDHVLARWRLHRPDAPAVVFGAAREAALPDSVATLVWWRPGSGMGDLSLPWKPDYELIHVFGGGYTSATRGSSVLRYPWDVFRGDAGHPHRKPVGLMRQLLSWCPGRSVVDPFMGSGSTLEAAKQLGRRAVGIEVDERYCELAATRLGQMVFDMGGGCGMSEQDWATRQSATRGEDR